MRVVVGKKPFVLGKKGEDALKAVHFYRYMTALDVAYLLFSPSALVRVRQLLSSLCGGVDFARNQYLYRFRMPDVSAGNPERIYVLGAKGREFLSRELGLSVDKGFRPDEGKHLSYTQVRHNLALTRFLVAAHRWAAAREDITLSQVRVCYDLGSGGAVEVDEKGKREQAPVIPDGWLYFEKAGRGKKPEWFPVLLEIDRGTMFRERFKRHVLSRVEFVRSGGYTRMFGKEAVMIAYATTGAGGEASEGRRKALCLWTQEALKDVGKENWGQIFRFTSFSLEEIYRSSVFEEKVWYRPDEESPVGLVG